MNKNEIKEVKEYSWGSIVTVLEENNTRTVVAIRTSYLLASFVVTIAIAFLVGLFL